MSEENTKPKANLALRLKSMLDESQRREAARAIEKSARAWLGDDLCFVYDREAAALAAVDLAALDAFVADIKRIRGDLETDYAFALKKLGEDE